MARKRSTKDFAIPMDEFHPNPSTAAAFADRKANDAAQDHLRDDLKRVEARIEASESPDKRLLSEKERITGLLRETESDRVKIEEHIAEAKIK